MILAVGSLPILLLELERDTLIHHDRVFLDVVNVAVLIASPSTTSSASRSPTTVPGTSAPNGQRCSS